MAVTAAFILVSLGWIPRNRWIGYALQALAVAVAAIWASVELAVAVAWMAIAFRLPAASMVAHNAGLRGRAIAYDASMVGLTSVMIVLTVRAL